MKITGKLVVMSAMLCAAMAVGCTKKVTLTVYNHSPNALNVQLTVPDGTRALGAVSSGGRLTHTVTIKTDDLPSACNLSAGAGSSQSFTVDQDTQGKLWFHITGQGKMTGPYDKDSVHAETSEPDEIQIRSEPRMIVK